MNQDSLREKLESVILNGALAGDRMYDALESICKEYALEIIGTNEIIQHTPRGGVAAASNEKNIRNGLRAQQRDRIKLKEN